MSNQSFIQRFINVYKKKKEQGMHAVTSFRT